MVQIVGIFGFAFLFLVISPTLRESLLLGLVTVTNGLKHYSPLSYIALGIVLIVTAVAFLFRKSTQR